ncbi:hypothetical protein ABZ953_33410 [Streptomyces sp. NPDC046465]|uniref:hypothetical protein n=1 Tax=Streptomyces sp. NPDC046465 TaxID=3155810 RepID=UPI0033EBF984
MAYAEAGLAELFARHRDEVLPRRERLSVREATQETGALLDRLHERWLDQADRPSRERCDAVRDALAALRIAVGHTLRGVLVHAPGGLGTPYSGTPRPAAGRPRHAQSSNRFVRFLRGEADAGPPSWPPPPPPQPVVSKDRLLDALGHALEAVDRSFGALAAEPAKAPAWDEDEDLVEVLHDLLTAAVRGSPDLALAKITALRDKVRLQRGIEAIGYDPHNPAHDARLFEFAAPAVPGGPGRCQVPALVHGTHVLRRGTVLPLPAADVQPPAADLQPPHRPRLPPPTEEG